MEIQVSTPFPIVLRYNEMASRSIGISQEPKRIEEEKRPVELFKFHLAEAAAIYCSNIVQSHGLETGDTFLVCDCGGGTVDLTRRAYVEKTNSKEETIRVNAIRIFKEKCYGQLQHMIQNFFNLRVKNNFKDDLTKFKTIEFDIDQYCSKLKQYVSEEIQKELNNNEWIIELYYNDVKSMFDPIFRRKSLTDLETFDGYVRTIIVPTDQIKQKTPDRHILKFNRLGKRGDKTTLNYEFASIFYPIYPDQAHILFKIYSSNDNNAHYCDDTKHVGSLRIILPDVELGLNRPIELALCIAEEEIKMTVRNKTKNCCI
ncbi:14180_t:CDS:2 [Ambispora leptoticha]|uniref:14180_t:CDS:1 n=1 Tax=Ambispora leptoticha TaxID=144679 RepID=A0A9N8ZRM1_9GLOM|nr:14180_t:CDS:2 [Ambispora leptoticha]